MHYRGKTLKAWAVSPEGDTIPIMKINRWNFDWQGIYTPESPIVIPKGSTFHLITTYDNTATNPFNPVLPPEDAIRGNSSYDEMMGLGFEWIPTKKGDGKLMLKPE